MKETGFGDLLRHYRIAVGLTQEELADRSGLSARGISDLERGARGLPRKDTLQLLLQGLDLSPADRSILVSAVRRAPSTASPRTQPQEPPALPAALTPLVGREAELTAVAALLGEPTVRLVTLTGPGGIGKTRLGLAAAERVTSDCGDSVVFVPLASLVDPAFVASAIAHHLGVREGAGHSLRDRVTAHLGHSRLLLILDNFEHLLSAAPLVAELLAACPSLTILVTSRAPLRLSGEHLFPVPPLALPDPRQFPSLDDLIQTEAVRLFVDRVRAGKPDFALTDANAPVVAQIVRRLDGLPLALELAAARVRVLSPAALLARLDRRLPLLTEGARDLPTRQQTLRNTIAWSYDLLSPDEQRLFRRLAVFVGGCTCDAAESVYGDEDLDLLSTLTTLVDESLIRQAEGIDEEIRYTMFETIREFASEALAASHEADVVRMRHADYFVDLARQGESAYFSPTEHHWSRRLAWERDNLRAALRWSAAHGKTDAFLQLVVGLVWFWDLWGDYSEGRSWVEQAIAVRDCVPESVLRIKATYYAGWFLMFFPDQHDRHRFLIEEALELALALDDRLWVARARYQLALNLMNRQRWEEARETLVGVIAAFRDIGDTAHLAAATHSLAQIYLYLHQVDQAHRLAAEALTLARREQFDRGVVWATRTLANAHARGGNFGRAIVLILEGATVASERHDRASLIEYLVSAAHIAQALDQPLEAAKLLAVAEVTTAALGLGSDWVDQQEDQLRQLAIPLVGVEAFNRALGTGRMMTLDEAMELVEDLARRHGQNPRRAGSGITRGPTTLV